MALDIARLVDVRPTYDQYALQKMTAFFNATEDEVVEFWNSLDQEERHEVWLELYKDSKAKLIIAGTPT